MANDLLQQSVELSEEYFQVPIKHAEKPTTRN
jgi:hypothetical protein